MGTMIVLGLLLFGISFGVGMVAGFVPQPHVRLVVQQLITAVTTVFFTAAFVVFYFSCRCQVDNFDLQYLAESIGVEANVDEPSDDEERLSQCHVMKLKLGWHKHFCLCRIPDGKPFRTDRNVCPT